MFGRLWMGENVNGEEGPKLRVVAVESVCVSRWSMTLTGTVTRPGSYFCGQGTNTSLLHVGVLNSSGKHLKTSF